MAQYTDPSCSPRRSGGEPAGPGGVRRAFAHSRPAVSPDFPAAARLAVPGDLSLATLLHQVAEAAPELLAARYAAIAVIGHDGHLEQFVHSTMPADMVTRMGARPASAGFPTADPPGNTVLGTPIRVGEAVFGTLYITARTDGAEFSAGDEQLATALAVAAGGAIANARLFAESEQRHRWLTASGEFATHILAPEAPQPLTALAEHAATAAMADFAIVVTPHGDDEVVIAAVSGIVGAELAGMTTPMTDTLAGLTIRADKASLVTDYCRDYPELAPTVDLGPVLVVPLTAGGLTWGCLVLGRISGSTAFTDSDLSLASAFATRAAVVLRLVDAREAELRVELLNDHNRIATDMHDHVIQELFALGMGLQGLASVTDHPGQVARILGYIYTLDSVISTLRTTIFALQPERHDPSGFQTQILAIAIEHTAQLGYTPHLRFAGPLDLRVSGALAADALAVIREAISNCARHAHASRLEILVALTDRRLAVDITDNGQGIGTPDRWSGLANMRTRAERHNGTFEVTAAKGGGSHLAWTVEVLA